MDTQETMTSIREFKNMISTNMEILENINPVKIKVHMVHATYEHEALC